MCHATFKVAATSFKPKKDYVQSSLVSNAWANQMRVRIITSVPDRVFVPTWYVCSLQGRRSDFKILNVYILGR